MTRLIKAAREFNRDQWGAALGEYALLFTLIAIICFSAIAAFGTKINSFFSAFSSTL
jgi:Flp pilus assembly pilin Flp